MRLVPITVSQLKCALHILIGDWYQKPLVGRGHIPAGVGTADCVQTDPTRTVFRFAEGVSVGTADFVQTRSPRTVCRCADGGDTSPPYNGCFVYHGVFSRVGIIAGGVVRCEIRRQRR